MAQFFKLNLLHDIVKASLELPLGVMYLFLAHSSASFSCPLHCVFENLYLNPTHNIICTETLGTKANLHVRGNLAARKRVLFRFTVFIV